MANKTKYWWSLEINEPPFNSRNIAMASILWLYIFTVLSMLFLKSTVVIFCISYFTQITVKKRIDVEQTNKWAGMDNIWWSHIVIIIYCHFRVSTCLGSTSRGKKRTRTLMIYLQVYKDAIKLLQIFQVLWMLGN